MKLIMFYTVKSRFLNLFFEFLSERYVQVTVFGQIAVKIDNKP